MGVKNYVIKRGVEYLLKEYVTRMVNLSIDPEKKTFQFSVELKGETEPVHVEVKNYEFEEKGGKTFLIIHDLSVSKEWMNVLAEKVVKEAPIEIGAGSKKFLEVLRLLHMV